MIVTVIHDDTDAVKLQIKALRENLAQVTPIVTFKSSCVQWDFKDNAFEENQTVLVLFSKSGACFSKLVFDSFKRYRAVKRKDECRMCVIIEAEGRIIEEDFSSLVGKENVAVVQDLQKSIVWLPKACAFVFKMNGQRNKLLECVIPKLNSVSNSDRLPQFRKDFITSLQDLEINIMDDFGASPARCGILFGTKGDDTTGEINNGTDAIKGNGGTIFKYIESHDKKSNANDFNEFIYRWDSNVLFVIHLLYVMEVINVTAVLGGRLWRVRKPKDETVNFRRRCSRLCSCCSRLCSDVYIRLGLCWDSLCFRLRLCWYSLRNIELRRVLKIIVISIVFVGNPSFILFFLTPFPYIWLFAHYVCGKDESKKTIVNCLVVWILGCSFALFFVYMSVDVYLGSIQEVWLLVYLPTCFFPLAVFQIIIVYHVMS